jgi:tRNA-dihydrouridine synthase
MIYTKRLEKCSNSVLKELYKIEEERPISIQLIGSDNDSFKKSIDFLSSYKYDILDINAGCPSKRALKAKEGGHLLRDLEKLRLILNTANKFSSKPISMKIRSGYNSVQELNQIARIINDSNIDLITIHGRTVKDRFDDSKFNFEVLKSLKDQVSIPVIGNGDIDSPVRAKKVLDVTKVDGLMIGRASMGNPKIFSQITDFLKYGHYIENEYNILRMFDYLHVFEALIDEMNYNNCRFSSSVDEIKYIELKRNAIWLTKHMKNAKGLRVALSKSNTLEELNLTLENATN